MRAKGITGHIGTAPYIHLFAILKRLCAMLSKSMFHIRWSSAWCADLLLLCSSENNVKFRKLFLIWRKLSILQIDVQLNIKTEKAFALCVTQVTQISMQWPQWQCEIINSIRKYALSTHINYNSNIYVGTLHWKNSNYFVSFSCETICQAGRGNAASILPILCYQGYTKLPLLSSNSSNIN